MVKSEVNEYCRRSYKYLTVGNFELIENNLRQSLKNIAYDFDQKCDGCKIEDNYVYPKTREKLR